jgi:hypothetical protein
MGDRDPGPSLRLRPRALVAAWLVIALGLGGFISAVTIVPLLPLCRASVRASGVVVRREPKVVVVSYTVEGKDYENEFAFVGPPNKEKSRLAIGDAVVVFHSSADPRQAALGDPIALLREQVIGLAVETVVMPTWLVFLLSRLVPYWRKQGVRFF